MAVFPIEIDRCGVDKSEIDKIARFESMTPIKGEIEFEAHGETSSRRTNGNSSSSAGDGDEYGMAFDDRSISASTPNGLCYSKSQSLLEERQKSRKYFYASNSVLNGGILRPPLEPTVSFIMRELNFVCTERIALLLLLMM